MARSFDELLAQLRQDKKGTFGVTITTNQTNGIAMYARGMASYSPAREVSGPFPMYRMPSIAAQDIECLFSNRSTPVNSTSSGGGIATNENQPFTRSKPEKLSMTIDLGILRPIGSVSKLSASLKFTSYSGSRFTIPLDKIGDCLVGVGTAIGNGSYADHAIYTIAFSDLYTPPN